MTDHQRSHRRDVDAAQRRLDDDVDEERWPGKHTLTQALARSSAMTLPTALRRQLESQLESDLADVRIHTDDHAAVAAAGLHARAFTVGQSVYFGRGLYDPYSQAGQRLIAHEIAHTVQQRGAVGGDLTVSSPGDAHEQQAERFGDAFVAGRRAPALTPVSRGVIARAVIQRDLLDGGLPAGVGAAPAPVNPQEATSSEMQQQAQAAIRDARASGGTPQVVSIVRQLRAAATPVTRAAVESAITTELTDEEREAISGLPASGQRRSAQSPNDAAHPGNAQSAQPAGTAGPAPAQTAQPAQAPPSGHAPVAQPANGAGHAPPAPPANAAAPDQAEPGQPGSSVAPGGAAQTNNREQSAQTGGAARSPATPADSGASAPAGASAAAPTAEVQPAAESGGERAHEVPPAAGRALIEAELAFHERWGAFAGHDEDGAGNRAMAAGQRFAGLMQGAGTDVSQGVQGGMMQFLMGQGIKLATTQTALGRVPGIGNIIGGGFAAYNLFSHGGAGIREMSTEAVHGIGGAFSAQNWRESPFLTAANLIAGIKSVLEIVGNVCQILSGLAYAFAAIAALGGLLSVFFPPLAMLLPYIPTALQFGRACGGIATVALAIATGLSPIPPILRAIHIIFTSNDPITLVQQEQTFHREAQGAIANYTASRLNNAAARVENPNAPDRGFYGGLRNEISEGMTTVRTSVGPGSRANTTEGLGVSDPELQNARTEAVAGGDTRNARRIGAEHFNPDARAAANQANTDRAHDRHDEAVDRRDQRQATADTANQAAADDPSRRNRRAAGRANDKLETANERVETAHRNAEMAEARADLGGRNASGGNMGDVGPAALDRERSVHGEQARERQAEPATEAYREMREGAEPVHAERNARGHVQLPDPPSTLTDLDGLDRQIEALRQQESALRQNAVAARRTHAQGAQVASGLTRSAQGVQQHVAGQQQRGAAAQQRVTAQTTDMQAHTTAANTRAQGQTGQAAAPLAGIASAARSVEGFLGRVPSNRFFDISGTRNNVHQFVLGMDTVMGAGPQQQAQQGAVTQVTAQRTSQTQQAAVANTQGVQAGQQVQQLMTEDASSARQASSQAAETAAGSTAQAGQAQSQIEQLTSQRSARWNALLGWAAQHRAIREQALAASR